MPSTAVVFALLSLLFAGVNDVVFKRYARKERSRGMYVFGMGVIWTMLQVTFFEFQGLSLSLDSATIGFGLLAGVLITLSNILLIESLTHIDVSLGSTIYRLNTIGVVVLSVLFLHESLGLLKASGIALGIAGVLLLYQRHSNPQHQSVLLVFIGIAVVASLLRAAYGVTTRAAILQHADPATMLLLISTSWIIGGACYALLRERRFRLTAKKALYSVLSGILVFLIANFLMLAVVHGEATVVIPIANLSFVIALFIAVAMRMEALTLKKSIAITCAAVSIILLAQV